MLRNLVLMDPTGRDQTDRRRVGSQESTKLSCDGAAMPPVSINEGGGGVGGAGEGADAPNSSKPGSQARVIDGGNALEQALRGVERALTSFVRSHESLPDLESVEAELRSLVAGVEGIGEGPPASAVWEEATCVMLSAVAKKEGESLTVSKARATRLLNKAVAAASGDGSSEGFDDAVDRHFLDDPGRKSPLSVPSDGRAGTDLAEASEMELEALRRKVAALSGELAAKEKEKVAALSGELAAKEEEQRATLSSAGEIGRRPGRSGRRLFACVCEAKEMAGDAADALSDAELQQVMGYLAGVLGVERLLVSDDTRDQCVGLVMRAMAGEPGGNGGSGGGSGKASGESRSGREASAERGDVDQEAYIHISDKRGDVGLKGASGRGKKLSAKERAWKTVADLTPDQVIDIDHSLFGLGVGSSSERPRGPGIADAFGSMTFGELRLFAVEMLIHLDDGGIATGTPSDEASKLLDGVLGVDARRGGTAKAKLGAVRHQLKARFNAEVGSAIVAAVITGGGGSRSLSDLARPVLSLRAMGHEGPLGELSRAARFAEAVARTTGFAGLHHLLSEAVTAIDGRLGELVGIGVEAALYAQAVSSVLEPMFCKEMGVRAYVVGGGQDNIDGVFYERGYGVRQREFEARTQNRLQELSVAAQFAKLAGQRGAQQQRGSGVPPPSGAVSPGGGATRANTTAHLHKVDVSLVRKGKMPPVLSVPVISGSVVLGKTYKKHGGEKGAELAPVGVGSSWCSVSLHRRAADGKQGTCVRAGRREHGCTQTLCSCTGTVIDWPGAGEIAAAEKAAQAKPSFANLLAAMSAYAGKTITSYEQYMGWLKAQ